MITILRIISLITAILAVVFFVFPILYGIDSDGRVEEFLKTPEMREKFESAADSRINKNKNLTSPLVQQAKIFASYLNPKPTFKRSPTISSRSKISSKLAVTPKFKLLATSYIEDDPNMSLALIDEPGQGRHWVRQSGKVGHLLIEQIKDGLVLVKGGKETFELAIEESTVKNVSAPSRRTSSHTSPETSSSTSGRSYSGRSYSSNVSKPSASASKKQEPDENERDARARALIDKLRTLQKDTIKDKATGVEDKDKAARIERLISQYQSTRISPEEAKKLGNLGRSLKGAKSDPNRTPSDTSKSR